MITAERLADSLIAGVLTTLFVGEERPVRGLELWEPGSLDAIAHGDLVIVVGAREADDVLAALDTTAKVAGLVVREPLAREPRVQARCEAVGTTLLALAEDAVLSATVTLVHDLIDQASRGAAEGWAGGGVYADLFAMADMFSSVLDGPVTIEDARSRVLAYSSGQDGADAARTSTIVGRQVPRAVRDHYRALGVFGRLAGSDEAFFVAGSAPDVRPRFIVPVRAGTEWIGSIWAVVDDEPPAEAQQTARAAADVLALHLLRLRALGEVDRHLQRDRVRALLRGDTSDPASDLPAAPWRAVALLGPREDLQTEERATVWSALAQRTGWRTPAIGDLDGVVYAVVGADQAGPGGWAWLQQVVRDESANGAAIAAVAGGAVATPDDVGRSVAQARELLALDDGVAAPVRSLEADWPGVVLARAIRGVRAAPPVSPVAALASHDAEAGTDLVATLVAVLDHWGEPARAARVLGVHANTVRNRLARLTEELGVDLEDPLVRLALRLEAHEGGGRQGG